MSIYLPGRPLRAVTVALACMVGLTVGCAEPDPTGPEQPTM